MADTKQVIITYQLSTAELNEVVHAMGGPPPYIVRPRIVPPSGSPSDQPADTDELLEDEPFVIDFPAPAELATHGLIPKEVSAELLNRLSSALLVSSFWQQKFNQHLQRDLLKE